MIRIIRTPKPIELSNDVQEELTNDYISADKVVWNKKYIKSALLDMTNKKCAYCECSLNKESNYMEVEHFYPKKLFPQLVVDWDNLIPSCKRCNINKSDHDTASAPIVNPVKEDPSDHLFIKSYRYYGIDDIGENTIGVLYLNDLEKAVTPRFDVGEATEELIIDIQDTILHVKQGGGSTRQKNKIVNGLKNLWRESLPYKEYSALVSTVIFTNPQLSQIVESVKSMELWDDELEDLQILSLRQCLSLEHSRSV